MRKYLLIAAVVFIIALTGCNHVETNVGKPPEVFVKIGDENYRTELGTYCWSGNGIGECVDTAGSIELWAGKTPIKVKPGEEIKFVMDYEPKPNKSYVTQMFNGEKTEIVVDDHQFTAPTQSGVYYYDYGVWWMDEKEANVSNGDAFYAFAIEVE